MEQYRIVMTLIEQGDTYVLQRRSSDPAIGAAGLVGCFGGKIEDGESPEEAAVRELAEETSLMPKIEELEFIGEVNVISDRSGRKIRVNSRVFKIYVDPSVAIQAKDGQKETYPKGKAQSHLAEMTPATRETFNRFILRSK